MSGDYELCYGDCDRIYIGKSFLNFKIHISENKCSFDRHKIDSDYSNIFISDNHSFNLEFNILYIENTLYKLSLIKILEINKYKYSDGLLNDQLDVNSTPL